MLIKISFQSLEAHCVQNPDTSAPQWSIDETGTKLPKCVVGCRTDLDCGPEFGINWQKLVCDKGICVTPECPKRLHPEYNAVIRECKEVFYIYFKIKSFLPVHGHRNVFPP